LASEYIPIKGQRFYFAEEEAMKNRVDYVDTLELPFFESRLRRSILRGSKRNRSEDNPSGYVDDGSLVSFVAGISAQHQSDVLNSTLLAQLAANKAYDREQQTDQWYRKYQEVLETVGWVVQAFEFEKYQASGSTFTVDQAVREILGAIATGDEMAVVNETLNALNALSDGSGQMVLWNSASHTSSAGNFQISICSETGPLVSMKNSAFYFTTTQASTRFLWFGYSSSDMTLYKSAHRMTLDEGVYAAVREAVIKKLGDRASTFVADLDI
jgi:hypothetical protein